jgi:hypothetical protein
MIEREASTHKSQEVAVRLYDKWVRERQRRPDILSTDNPKELPSIAKNNFKTQLVEPRRSHLQDLKKVVGSMMFADQAALLATIELPLLETSSLVHRLARQVAEDPQARYFSKINLADNCGCGCGCGCGAMVNLDYLDRIAMHHQTKPYSIDPFNELETPANVRDELLAKDFLDSFERLSASISERVNARCFKMGRAFSEEA